MVCYCIISCRFQLFSLLLNTLYKAKSTIMFHCIQRRFKQSERSEALAKICFAEIGNFGERLQALPLLNTPLVFHSPSMLHCAYNDSKIRGLNPKMTLATLIYNVQ